MFIGLFLGALVAVTGQYVPSFPNFGVPVPPVVAAISSFSPPLPYPVPSLAVPAAVPSPGVVTSPGFNNPILYQDHAPSASAVVPQSRIVQASISSVPAFQQTTAARLPSFSEAWIHPYAAAFVQHVSDMIASNDGLRSVYDLQIESPAQDSDEYFHTLENALQRLGYPDHGDIVHFAGQSIYSIADALSPELFANARARTIGKFLVSQGLLSADNALELATHYVTHVLNVLNAANAAGRPLARVEAAIDGVVNFLLTLGVSIPVHSYVLSRSFNEE